MAHELEVKRSSERRAAMSKHRLNSRALWTLVGSFLLVSAAQPTAYGLEFPMTTSISLPASANLTMSVALNSEVDLSEGAALYTQLDLRTSLFASQMALAAVVSQQVEMARTSVGAKKVAKSIMLSEYAWGADQFNCLNRLWTKESHWNYKARNKRSGAHGIPQALPAIRMESISSDWRTNPVTQIRWGLRYIEARYDSPCGAWAKFKRSRYY